MRASSSAAAAIAALRSECAPSASRRASPALRLLSRPLRNPRAPTPQTPTASTADEQSSEVNL